MSHTDPTNTTPDLGPLAWVMDELRASLDEAVAVVRQFVTDQQTAQATDLADVDSTPLRMARQGLHQAAGALDMVGMAAPALTVRALEAALARLVQRPALATPETADTVGWGARALVDFLDRALRQRGLPDLALFPAYREWQQLAGAGRAHPADLWAAGRHATASGSAPLARGTDARHPDATLPPGKAYQPGPAVRAHFDRLVLLVVKQLHPQAAAPLAQLAAGLSRGAVSPVAVHFWWAAAAYFEAVAQGLLPDSVHVKRAASSILLQYSHWSQGQEEGMADLDADLLALVAQAPPPADAQATPALTALWQAQGWRAADAWNWEQRVLGLVDPAQLGQARRAVGVFQRWWSAWTESPSPMVDSVTLMSDVAASLPPLHPACQSVVEAWEALSRRAADAAGAGADWPPALTLELSLHVLCLGAELEDFDPLRATLPERLAQLAQRLTQALAGDAVSDAEPWMAQLYRDRTAQATLEQLVRQVQGELAGVESTLDAWFRDVQGGQAQAAADVLAPVGAQLERLRGVVQMLGLDAGVSTLDALEGAVTGWAPTGQVATGALPDDAEMARIGANLAALGTLLDVFIRQPERARQAFVFDAERQQLEPADGPQAVSAGAPASAVAVPQAPDTDSGMDAQAEPEPAVETPASAPVLPPQAAVDAEDDDDAELLAIFTDEAREVLAQARGTWAVLQQQPHSTSDLTALRRSFHTLKGSARMVGQQALGEAAWAMEQLLNAWLAEQRPASAELLALTGEVLAALAPEVEALAEGQATRVEALAPAVRASADALRLHGQLRPLWPEPEPEPPLLDEAVKVIGPLCIDLELYNVFLNEADEWSRRLSMGLSEWALTSEQPVDPQWSALAHSLAGGAGTVGYTGLSQLARALEHALDRVGASAAIPPVLDDDGHTLLSRAADEARTLLHQFAAGFLKEPLPATLEALEALAIALPGDAEPDAAKEAVTEAVTEAVAEEHAELPSDAVTEPAAPAAAEPVSENEGSDLPAEVSAPGLLDDGWSPDPTVLTAAAPTDEVIDTLDRDLFGVFEDEAAELLPRLGAALRQWVARPDNTGARAEVLRNLHTFKGSARLAGAMRLGEMAHALESAVLALPEVPLDATALRPLLGQLDALAERFEALRRVFQTAEQTRPARARDPIPAEGVRLTAPEGPMLHPVAPARLEPLPAPSHMVRVRADLLDRLMTQTGDVMITRGRLDSDIRTLRQSFKDMSANLERLRSQLRDLEMQTETQMQSRLAQSRDTDARFDPLEFDRYTRVQELTRQLAESVNDVATVQYHLQRSVEAAEGSLAAQARQTRDLQRDLLRTRLVAFDSLAERLHRTLRQTADAVGKPVSLLLDGADVEVDRGVLDRLAPVLEHLLRNAVVHGIEAGAVRAAAGKPAEGRVALALQQNGNDLTLTLTDDGAGLDHTRLRERAVALGLHAPEVPFDPDDAARSIFAPGLTTASEVTELAGRGIGLDVVRTEVLGLGGRIECFALDEGGTGFHLVVPLSTAVTQVVMLRVGDFTFGVPAPWVEAVRRVHAPELTAAYVSGQWRSTAALMPFYWAGALLALSTESTDPMAHQSHSWPVLEFYSAGQRVAWHVDEVLGHQEVVVKPLGPQLARLPGLAGATVLASGAVALIYNPVALASLYGDAARTWVRAQRAQGIQGVVPVPAERGAGSGQAEAPLVLVVDDSITVRRVTQRLLKREGYRVALAADGLQALERLREAPPVVVLCDIEMPRMDGFEFVRHLRQEPAWADLPVVMITSRLADKHRDHAESLGVNHYLGKPYSEDDLLGLVAAYARLAPGAPGQPQLPVSPS